MSFVEETDVHGPTQLERICLPLPRDLVHPEHPAGSARNFIESLTGKSHLIFGFLSSSCASSYGISS